MPTNPQEQTPKVESEIEKLRAQLQEKERQLKEQKTEKPAPEISRPEKPDEKEIAEVKKELEVKEPEEKALEPLSPNMKDPEILKELTNLRESGKSLQILQLAYLAFDKGVSYATEIARKTNDPSILAEFRGIITGELYEKLKAKNKI